jgi:hypothetical protein
MQDSRPPIYSLTLDIAVKKGKRIQNLEAWAVSRYDNPADIMAHCKTTMDRLRNDHFKKSHKGERRVIVKKVRSKKIVGYVNSNAI